MRQTDLKGYGKQSHRLRRDSGQALLEFAFGMMLLLVLACGVIDLSRAINDKQVLSHLAREGSNLASRGSSLTDAASAVLASSSPLDLNNNGCIIISSVQNSGGVVTILDQVTQGSLKNSSQVGAKGASGNKVHLPATTPTIPQPNQTVFVTEVFYSFAPATPIGTLLGLIMPSSMYDVAYF